MSDIIEQFIESWKDHRINHLIKNMFVDTADDNYIVSRWAAMNDLHIDFYWSGAHAVEKYLKSILMFNGFSAKKYGHDIVSLFDDIRSILPDFEILTDRFPPWVYERPELYDLNVDNFVDRIAKYGSTQARYFEVSYDIGSHDLHCLDNLVWHVRRYCCPRENGSAKKNSSINDRSSILGKLEEVQKSKEERYNQIKFALIAGNFAFDPVDAKSSMHYAAGRSSMLKWTISDLDRCEQDSVRKVGAQRTLLWILDNMPINKFDREIIKDKLASIK